MFLAIISANLIIGYVAKFTMYKSAKLVNLPVTLKNDCFFYEVNNMDKATYFEHYQQLDNKYMFENENKSEKLPVEEEQLEDEVIKVGTSKRGKSFKDFKHILDECKFLKSWKILWKS